MEAVVHEKGDRAGGSMLLSSGVVWRHRSLDEFRAECPAGDPALQARVVDGLDDALAWLEALGAPVLERETGNPRTVGWRFDTAGLTDALVRAAGDVRLGQVFPEARILATGGFAGRFARERGLLLRANPWSEGDGLAWAVARGAGVSGGMDEFYGRNMPAAVPEHLFVDAAQLYGRHALVLDDDGREFFPGEPSWSENDLVQATARLPARAAWYVVDARALRERVRERSVADLVEAARTAGGDVRPAGRAAFRAAAVAEARRGAVSRSPCPRVGHAHDRRAPDRRARARPATGPDARRGPLRGRGRRGRHLHGRLRQRPGGGARLRPDRGPNRRVRGLKPRTRPSARDCCSEQRKSDCTCPLPPRPGL